MSNSVRLDSPELRLSDIKTPDEFRAALVAGHLKCVGRGSERGYLRQGLLVVRGIVRTGIRSGLLKVQFGGRGGPYGNSSRYTDNRYYSLS